MWFFLWAELAVRPRTGVPGQAFWGKAVLLLLAELAAEGGTMPSLPHLIACTRKIGPMTVTVLHPFCSIALVCRAGPAEARA